MGSDVAATGKLVLCPTPLGNLEDITLRVLRALRESDVIFAEDTRVSKKLLHHFDIHTPLQSFPEGAHATRLRTLRSYLREGKTVAMVSDAGMPGISDPGAELVREAHACGAAVEALPGPSAVPGALVLSGFAANAFRFDGFPPRKPGERRAYLGSLEHETAPVIWFEAPNRIRALLEDAAAVLPERRLFVLREYTKRFEQHLWGTAQSVLAELDTPRGEFTIVLEGTRANRRADRTAPDARALVAALKYLRETGMSAKDATEALRLATGLPRNELYRLAIQPARKPT
jgi:16S rRNA (cytidine1402-2'-O)-methyltransferase